MIAVEMAEAKNDFENIIIKVKAGEEVIIEHSGLEVARIIPSHRQKTMRTLGSAKDKIKVHDDFNAPLPPEILNGFNS